jgi:hypothetical protein
MSHTHIPAILRQVLHSFYTSHSLANNSAVEHKRSKIKNQNDKLKCKNLAPFDFPRDCHAALAMTIKKGLAMTIKKAGNDGEKS